MGERVSLGDRLGPGGGRSTGTGCLSPGRELGGACLPTIPNLQMEKLSQRDIKNLVIQWKTLGLNSNLSDISLNS